MGRAITPGRQSTEWRKTMRAELIGCAVLLAGGAWTWLGHGLEGLGVMAVGAYLIAHTGAAYARSRGDVKAAAEALPGSVNLRSPKF